jgi:hypothetical protein
MDGVCRHEICVAQSQKSNHAYGNIIFASMGATWRRRKHKDFDAVHEFPPQTSVHVGKSYAKTSCIKLPKLQPSQAHGNPKKSNHQGQSYSYEGS